MYFIPTSTFTYKCIICRKIQQNTIAKPWHSDALKDVREQKCLVKEALNVMTSDKDADLNVQPDIIFRSSINISISSPVSAPQWKRLWVVFTVKNQNNDVGSQVMAIRDDSAKIMIF